MLRRRLFATLLDLDGVGEGFGVLGGRTLCDGDCWLVGARIEWLRADS